jgi:hypothetical protein
MSYSQIGVPMARNKSAKNTLKMCAKFTFFESTHPFQVSTAKITFLKYFEKQTIQKNGSRKSKYILYLKIN